MGLFFSRSFAASGLRELVKEYHGKRAVFDYSLKYLKRSAKKLSLKCHWMFHHNNAPKKHDTNKIIWMAAKLSYWCTLRTDLISTMKIYGHIPRKRKYVMGIFEAREKCLSNL